jgi:hypothetical protein
MASAECFSSMILRTLGAPAGIVSVALGASKSISDNSRDVFDDHRRID